MIHSLKLSCFAGLLLGVAIFAFACGTDHAQARFVNASPDAPSLDIVVDGKTLATSLAYEAVAPASGYSTVDAGNRKLEERSAGTPTDLINSNVNFGAQHQYTILATGCNTPTNCNQTGSSSTIAAVVLTDNNSAPANGNVNLRIVHASPSGPGRFDIYIVSPGSDISTMAPTIPALAYQQASGYQGTAPTSNEVVVAATGDTAKTRIIDQTFSLTAGQVRTLVILDVAGGGAVSATPLVLSDLN